MATRMASGVPRSLGISASFSRQRNQFETRWRSARELFGIDTLISLGCISDSLLVMIGQLTLATAHTRLPATNVSQHFPMLDRDCFQTLNLPFNPGQRTPPFPDRVMLGMSAGDHMPPVVLLRAPGDMFLQCAPTGHIAIAQIWRLWQAILETKDEATEIRPVGRYDRLLETPGCVVGLQDRDTRILCGRLDTGEHAVLQRDETGAPSGVFEEPGECERCGHIPVDGGLRRRTGIGDRKDDGCQGGGIIVQELAGRHPGVL